MQHLQRDPCVKTVGMSVAICLLTFIRAEMVEVKSELVSLQLIQMLADFFFFTSTF